MPFQLSPGVAVVEKDFSSIVPAVSTSVGAFAGEFAWGPVMEPSTVSSENVLVQRFAKPNASTATSFYTAANFLSYTNNLLLVRTETAGMKNAVSTQTGGLSAITVTAGGSGFDSEGAAPAVTISAPDIAGGVQAEATAEISGGAITAIAITNGGSGYTNPTVTITAAAGDSGTGATATVVEAGGVITGITIDNGGSGYKTAPTVTISDPAGTGATVGAITIGDSEITAINITTVGTGYTAAPTVTVTVPQGGNAPTLNVSIATGGVLIRNGEHYIDSFAGGAGVVGEFAAKYAGDMGDSLRVEMADANTYASWAYKAEFDSAPGTSAYAAAVNGSNDEMHIIVIDEDGEMTGEAGTVLEKFAFVSKASDAKRSDGTNNYYKDVLNARSEYVWWMDHTTNTAATVGGQASQATLSELGGISSSTFKDLNAVITSSLSGGDNAYGATDAEKIAAFDLFNNAEQYDVSLLLAGKASATVAAHLIQNIAEVRLDCVAFVSPQDVNTGDVITGSTSTAINSLNAYRDALPSSSYGVMDSGFKYQYDRYNDTYRYIPLNGDIAGLCARTDYTNDPWFSPGGLNRGQVKSVVKLAVNPNKTQRDELYKNGVNPVVTFPGEGTVLFGDKTLLAKPSAFDRINVRRLFIVMEKAVATAAKFQLFEFNDSFTRAQFRNLVEPFLRDVQGRRGIIDFRVKCDESNNTGEVIDRNEFVADIFVKPNRSINFITLNFVAARSAINFNEIGG